MNQVSEFFEKYSRGILDDAGIESLNRQLVEIYFHTQEDLSREELEYTEDLVIELYAKNLLEERYSRIFETKLRDKSSLYEKYTINKQLFDTSQSFMEKRMQQVSESEQTDEQEEAQLNVILQEVFQKVEAEKERSSIKQWVQNLRLNLMNLLEDLFSKINFNPLQVRLGNEMGTVSVSQVRLIAVMASILFIATIAWFLLPTKRDIGSEYAVTTDSTFLKETKTRINKITDKKKDEPGNILQEQIPQRQMAENKEKRSPGKQSQKEKISELLAANYDAPRFDQTFVRGDETSSARDSLIQAADFYNEAILTDDIKQLDQCIKILESLMNKRSFTDLNTISEINFFLGNCYLAKGLKQDDPGLFNSSLRSFGSVHHKSNLFVSSRYYSAIAVASSGNSTESIRILDSLMQIRYYYHGKVKELRDSLTNIIRSK